MRPPSPGARLVPPLETRAALPENQMHPTIATYLTAATLADRERATRRAALRGELQHRPSRRPSVAGRIRAARHALALIVDVRPAAGYPEVVVMPHVPDTDRG